MKKLLILLCLLPMLAQARPAQEDKRIEHLLSVIKNLDGATFIRSGKSYDGAAAEEHLRMKLNRAGERVQTAEQFIDGIASSSYLSGKPYKIQFKDGKSVDAGPFLHGKLKAFKPQ